MKRNFYNSILGIFLSIIGIAGVLPGCAQHIPADKPKTINPNFDQKISSLLSFDVPLIGVEELKQRQESVVLLDAREWEEYAVSHIEGARYIGYKDLNEESFRDLPRDQEIVLYCSIGYRSEKIGQKLQKMGFTNISNLYGSIFEWVNRGNPVVDQNGIPTDTVHGYNKAWSKWIDKQKVNVTW